MNLKTINRIIAFLIVIAIIPVESANNAVVVDVTILNLPPEVVITDATRIVFLRENETKTVWCNGTATDLNSYKNINQLESVLWSVDSTSENSSDDVRYHYKQRRLTGEELNITTIRVSAKFEIKANATGGQWRCNVIAYDEEYRSYNTTELMVYKASCSNGIKDIDEDGIDCGGPCPPCDHCYDGELNYGEEDVDCGGPCPPCPTCNDGIQNQGEFGVDCGGPCPPCPTCNDGIWNQGEEYVDCGGPCPPCPCSNEIQDPGEEGMDCGGPCPPCHCFNGVHDENEVGLDCGGKCPPCPHLPYVPRLNVTGPDMAYVNDNVTIMVFDDTGTPVKAILIITKPDGLVLRARTEDNGSYLLNIDAGGSFGGVGTWTIKATKAGYMPDSHSILVMYRIREIIPNIIERSKSNPLPIALIFFVIAMFYVLSRRTKIIADVTSIGKLYETGGIEKYGKIFTTQRVYDKIQANMRERIVEVRLGYGEIEESERISEEYGITLEHAELVVLSRKLRAKRFITSYELPPELKRRLKTRVVNIEEEA